MKGYGIYVQNDLLEPKHYKAMGSSIWLYLWCLDKMTSINENGIGLVLGGKPIKLKEINKDLDLSDKTYTRYVTNLQAGGYIEATRTPYGYVIKVTKAKKKFSRNTKRTVHLAGRTVHVAGENRTCGGYKEDNTVDNTNTLGEQSSPDSNNQKKDMSFNRYSDEFEEGVVDLDGDGSLSTEEKKPTRKYPNAPAVRKVFQEVLGRNPANWRENKNQLQACENLSTERGIEKVRSALEYYKEHQDDKYCPSIDSPYDLDSKWSKLGAYKLKHE